MISVRINYANAEQLLKPLPILQYICVSSDKSSTLTLVCGIYVERVPSVIRANNFYYFW